MNNRLLHTPDGVRDIYGNEYQKKLNVENAIHEMFISYGYSDIQTPGFEYYDLFDGEIGIKVYDIQPSPSQITLGIWRIKK